MNPSAQEFIPRVSQLKQNIKDIDDVIRSVQQETPINQYEASSS